MISTRNRLTKIIVLILSCIVFQAMASMAYAQENGFFFMERPKLGIDSYYKLAEEIRRTPNLKTKTTDQDIWESMTVATNGWVYHPDLMKYRLSFTPEWRQESFRHTSSDSDGSYTDRQTSRLLSYDAQTTFLANKPCSLDVFANRSNRQMDLTNTQDSDITTNTWGTRFNFTNSTLPASIAYIKRKYDQTGFYQSREDRDQVQATIRHNAANSATELTVLHDNAVNTTANAITPQIAHIRSKATNTELTNTYFFTDDERVRLDSQIYNARADYSSIRENTWVVSESLFWQHNKDLLSRYYVNYTRHDSNGLVDKETTLSAGLTHHLYDQLTTNLGAMAVFNDYSGGSENLYQPNLSFLYRRPIPHGSVELGAAYNYAVTKRSGGSDVIPTESRPVLKTGEATTLDKENIIVESIVVTDTSGTIVYTENIDYLVQKVGQDVRISRMLLGGIKDGQQVIVHYSYRIDSAYDDTRFGQNYRCSVKLWSFMYLTYTHGSLNQNILSGEPPNYRMDHQYNTVRLRFETKYSETQFLYDKQNRSNGNSCTTKSVSQRIYFRPALNFYFNFSGDLGNRDFTDIDATERFYTVGASAGWTPKYWCDCSLVCLRNKISGDQQDVLYTEVGPTIKLVYGVWTGTISYRLRDQNDRQNHNSLWRQEVYLGINRRLW